MRAISTRVRFTGGTTELTITPVIASRSSPARENRLRVSTPYSSTVCSRAVVRRQLATSSASRNTPKTVFVFPTSIVSSICLRPARPPVLQCPRSCESLHIRNVACNHGRNLTLVALHPQQSSFFQPGGHANEDLSSVCHPHALAARIARSRLKPLHY